MLVAGTASGGGETGLSIGTLFTRGLSSAPGAAAEAVAPELAGG